MVTIPAVIQIRAGRRRRTSAFPPSTVRLPESDSSFNSSSATFRSAIVLEAAVRILAKATIENSFPGRAAGPV